MARPGECVLCCMFTVKEVDEMLRCVVCSCKYVKYVLPRQKNCSVLSSLLTLLSIVCPILLNLLKYLCIHSPMESSFKKFSGGSLFLLTIIFNLPRQVTLLW